MNKTMQKAIIIDNISSPYIKEAIIILRSFSPDTKNKVIADAEKIVRDYIEKIKTDDSDITLYNRPSKSSKQSKLKTLKIAGIFFAAAFLAFGIYFAFFA